MRMPEALPDRSIIEALRAKGYKATPQRIAICRFAANSRAHPTAEEVYRKVKKKFPTLSPATVYKTMQVLKEANKVQELAFYDEKTRFDANMQPHIHLVCLTCDRIEDLNDPKVEEFVQQFSGKLGFMRKGQRIDFYGTCKDCQKETSSL